MTEYGEPSEATRASADVGAGPQRQRSGAKRPQRRSSGSPGGSGGPRKAPTSALNPRLLAVAAAAVVIVILLIVLAVSVLRRDSTSTEQEVVTSVSQAIIDAQTEAETAGTQFLDMSMLRGRLDAITGFVVGFDATEDGQGVGVAARRIDGPACVLVWTSAGGPRSATVYDPNLPCVPAMALQAASSS